MNEKECLENTAYYEGLPQHIAIYLHLVASVFSLVIIMIFVIMGRHLLFFHANFKILFVILLCGYVVHGISLSGLQIVHIKVLWSANSLCDLYLSNEFCYWGRFPSAAATNLFVYTQMAMIVERLIATKLLRKYEKMGCFYGIVMGITVVTAAILSVVIMFHKWDLKGRTTYCATSNSYTVKEVFYVTSVTNAICAFITFIGCFLVQRQNHLLKASNSTVADIIRRYQNAENSTVLNMLAPQTTFLGCFLVLYGTLNGISYYLAPNWTQTQLFKCSLTFVNIIPYYTMFSPILLWSLLKKHREKRKNLLKQIANDRTDARLVYFNSYRTMWEIT